VYAETDAAVASGVHRGGFRGRMTLSGGPWRPAGAFSRPRGATTMGQAIVDPAELRRFAGNLRKFSEEVLAHMQMVQRQLGQLGSSWRDQEQQKFAAEFEAQLTTFKRFAESTGEYVPYLIRKAERVEEYLQQR
jgi:uncharacterized protein YukE